MANLGEPFLDLGLAPQVQLPLGPDMAMDPLLFDGPQASILDVDREAFLFDLMSAKLNFGLPDLVPQLKEQVNPADIHELAENVLIDYDNTEKVVVNDLMSADLNFGLPDLVPQPQEQVNKISAASKIADMLNSEDHVPVCSNPSNAMNILQDISVAERELMASADADHVALQAKINAKGDAPLSFLF